MARIYMPPYLQQSENLVRTNQEGGTHAAIRHHDRPRMSCQEIDQTRDQLADGALNTGITHQIVGGAEPEDDSLILIARRVPDPYVPRRSVLMDPVRRF